MASVPPHEWYIVFLPSRTHWLLRLGRPPFQHVFAFSGSDEQGWHLAEWGMDGFWSGPISKALVDGIIAHVRTCGVMLRYQPGYHQRSMLPLLFTCTSMVAELCRIPGFVWTPKQLHDILKRRGAETLIDVRGGSHVLHVAQDPEAAGGRERGR